MTFGVNSVVGDPAPYFENAVVTYVCSVPGFFIDGEVESTCVAGSWSLTEPTCMQGT